MTELFYMCSEYVSNIFIGDIASTATVQNVGHVFRTHAKQFRQFDGILLCLDTVERTH